jgi:calcineurin-like phosphoesterase family protein
MNIWFTSDLHFGHHGMCKFLNYDGSKIRPWDSIEEMDEVLVERFNERVKPEDKCYILGDIALNLRAIPMLERLNCKNLRLIKGNHDTFKLEKYLPYFTDIRAYHVIDKMLLGHIPVHPDCLGRWGFQIHGHLHNEVVLLPDGTPDNRYMNISVERTDFYPISLDNIIEERNRRGICESQYSRN